MATWWLHTNRSTTDLKTQLSATCSTFPSVTKEGHHSCTTAKAGDNSLGLIPSLTPFCSLQMYTFSNPPPFLQVKAHNFPLSQTNWPVHSSYQVTCDYQAKVTCDYLSRSDLPYAPAGLHLENSCRWTPKHPGHQSRERWLRMSDTELAAKLLLCIRNLGGSCHLLLSLRKLHNREHYTLSKHFTTFSSSATTAPLSVTSNQRIQWKKAYHWKQSPQVWQLPPFLSLLGYCSTFILTLPSAYAFFWDLLLSQMNTLK